MTPSAGRILPESVARGLADLVQQVVRVGVRAVAQVLRLLAGEVGARAAEGVATLTVEFSPMTPGEHTAGLVVVSNAVNAASGSTAIGIVGTAVE